MQSKPKNRAQLGFYSTFEEQLNHKHPLFRLEKEINWSIFEDTFSKLYSETMGRSGSSAESSLMFGIEPKIAMLSYCRTDGLYEINSSDSNVKILVVPTNEELEIANQCYRLLN